MSFNQWSTLHANAFETSSKLTIAEEAYKAGQAETDFYYRHGIQYPNAEFLQDIFNNTIKFVNDHLGWELSDTAQGAYNVWYNGKEFGVDVETSDGGASTIRYAKFLDIIRKSGNPDYKLTQEEFSDCCF